MRRTICEGIQSLLEFSLLSLFFPSEKKINKIKYEIIAFMIKMN